MFYPIELWGLVNFVSTGNTPVNCLLFNVSLVELESTTYTLAYHYYFHSLTFIPIGILDTFSKI